MRRAVIAVRRARREEGVGRVVEVVRGFMVVLLIMDYWFYWSWDAV